MKKRISLLIGRIISFFEKNRSNQSLNAQNWDDTYDMIFYERIDKYTHK